MYVETTGALRMMEQLHASLRLKEEEGAPLQTAVVTPTACMHLGSKVLASYLEIYQEKMYDLLVKNRTDLQVRWGSVWHPLNSLQRLHPTLGPHVPGLIQSPVTTSAEALKSFLVLEKTERSMSCLTLGQRTVRWGRPA